MAVPGSIVVVCFGPLYNLSLGSPVCCEHPFSSRTNIDYVHVVKRLDFKFKSGSYQDLTVVDQTLDLFYDRDDAGMSIPAQ